ncbi:MAG: hypothetical protein AMXMBFR42_01280 [Burkholderiales bacterium]
MRSGKGRAMVGFPHRAAAVGLRRAFDARAPNRLRRPLAIHYSAGAAVRNPRLRRRAAPL